MLDNYVKLIIEATKINVNMVILPALSFKETCLIEKYLKVPIYQRYTPMRTPHLLEKHSNQIQN